MVSGENDCGIMQVFFFVSFAVWNAGARLYDYAGDSKRVVKFCPYCKLRTIVSMVAMF